VFSFISLQALLRPHVTASVPERNYHFISNPKTAQRERGRMKEGKKKRERGKFGTTFSPFFSFLYTNCPSKFSLNEILLTLRFSSRYFSQLNHFIVTLLSMSFSGKKKI